VLPTRLSKRRSSARSENGATGRCTSRQQVYDRNLSPHVAVSAVMPLHLMPLWALGGAQAGLMAGAFAFDYMCLPPANVFGRVPLVNAKSGQADSAISFFRIVKTLGKNQPHLSGWQHSSKSSRGHPQAFLSPHRSVDSNDRTWRCALGTLGYRN
jgi:hypothetical protein